MAASSKPPLADSYPAHVVLVVLTLFPGLINTSAIALDAPVIGADLHVTPSLAATLPLLSDAALAFGCVLAAELTRRVERRYLFLVFIVVSGLTALASALATTFPVLLGAHVLHGLMAGMLFVVALPPLLTTFGSAKIRPTATLIVPALFGASTLGPLIGGAVASPSLWRSLFAAEVVVAAIAFVLATRTIAKNEPQAAADPIDWPALSLSAIGSACVYAGVGRLAQNDVTDPLASGPIAAGLAAYAAMIAIEARKKQPLVPVRALATSIAVVGTIATVMGSATFAAFNQSLTLTLLHVGDMTPHATGLALWPIVLSALAAGFAFGRLVTTKWVVLTGAAGLGWIALGALLAHALSPLSAHDAGWIGMVGGFGAGLSVSPGLFVVALSFERALVGRAVALLNLFRLTGGFISAPGVLHFIGSHTTSRLTADDPATRTVADASARAYVSGNALPAAVPRAELEHALAAGIADAYVLIALLALGGLIAIAALLIATRYRLRAPDLARFDAGHPAFDTPILRWP